MTFSTELNHIFSLDEVAMTEDLHAWFQGLGYKEGFGPDKVPYTKIRKRMIDTCTITSVVSQEEIKDTFCEEEVFKYFFLLA